MVESQINEPWTIQMISPPLHFLSENGGNPFLDRYCLFCCLSPEGWIKTTIACKKTTSSYMKTSCKLSWNCFSERRLFQLARRHLTRRLQLARRLVIEMRHGYASKIEKKSFLTTYIWLHDWPCNVCLSRVCQHLGLKTVIVVLMEHHVFSCQLIVDRSASRFNSQYVDKYTFFGQCEIYTSYNSCPCSSSHENRCLFMLAHCLGHSLWKY